jgi:hypothetical protein
VQQHRETAPTGRRWAEVAEKADAVAALQDLGTRRGAQSPRTQPHHALAGRPTGEQRLHMAVAQP